MSQQIKGGVIKNSIRALLLVMKRLPVEFPPDVTGGGELGNLQANMGNWSVKRAFAEVESDQDAGAAQERRRPVRERQRAMKALIAQTAERARQESGVQQKPNWLYTAVFAEFLSQEVVVNYHRARCAVTGRSLLPISLLGCLFQSLYFRGPRSDCAIAICLVN